MRWLRDWFLTWIEQLIWWWQGVPVCKGCKAFVDPTIVFEGLCQYCYADKVMKGRGRYAKNK